MIKPDSLRAVLLAANPLLQAAPNTLQMSLEDGSITATLGRGNGWRYHYTLVVQASAFKADSDALVAPLIAWLRQNQPDLLLNHEELLLITFTITAQSDGSSDIVIKIPLTEAVVVSESAGVVTATHRPEPQVAGINEEESVASQLLLNGTPVSWPPQDADALAEVLWAG
jgi:hypothetical protein